MNEQLIKDLWWKARIGYNNQNCDPEVLEKFAELIVRECVEVCNQHPSRIVSNNWIADSVAPDIVSRLKEHFGLNDV